MNLSFLFFICLIFKFFNNFHDLVLFTILLNFINKGIYMCEGKQEKNEKLVTTPQEYKQVYRVSTRMVK